MDQIIAQIKDGRFIEAIKQFRALYGSGLKEAKDACDVLRAALGHTDANAYKTESHLVISRFENEYDWSMRMYSSRADADDAANEICANTGCADEIYVARVTAKSARKLSMNSI